MVQSHIFMLQVLFAIGITLGELYSYDNRVFFMKAVVQA